MRSRPDLTMNTASAASSWWKRIAFFRYCAGVRPSVRGAQPSGSRVIQGEYFHSLLSYIFLDLPFRNSD